MTDSTYKSAVPYEPNVGIIDTVDLVAEAGEDFRAYLLPKIASAIAFQPREPMQRFRDRRAK